MFKRLLLCYDGSDDSRPALKRGADLATYMGSEVSVLLIVPSSLAYGVTLARSTGHDCTSDSEDGCRQNLAEAVSSLRARGIVATGYLESGNVIDVIVEYAKKLGIDLIVVGQYPPAEARRWWSPSQRASLAERATCSVFISIGA